MTTIEARERLLELMRQRALKFGSFALASGKISPYYLDSKQVLFHSEAATCLGELLWDATHDLNINAIGGLEVGAIPMTSAAVVRYHQAGRQLEGFFVRKAAKDHGSGNLIEGVLSPGDAVVIVDDVLTTGGSAMRAVQAVEAIGVTVSRVVCIVDRLAGAAELFADYDFRPIFTIRDFGIDPE